MNDKYMFSVTSDIFTISSHSDTQKTGELCKLCSLLHAVDVLIIKSVSVAVCLLAVSNSQDFFF